MSEVKDTANYKESGSDGLVGRLKAGDHSAAEELVDLYHRQIYLFFRRLGHSCQMSEDLTQECFLAAWQHIGQLRNSRALSSWIYRIAANTSRYCKRTNKNRETVDIEGLDAAEAVDLPDETIEKTERLTLLRNSVLELPLKLRQAVVLHYMQYLTISEAAEAAGIREGTFKSRLSRALKILRSVDRLDDSAG